ncbi:DUF342 domain-containing protein [Geomesophilobacter sediminis]|uniref:DUF342 domain-containing protein n=1 Tax=Geomesophilobacter sediminis TaxID=2798584 RepID=A0A8J7M0V4_9BACT|nr:FapA family protein [Geomesophilobacter sediminis]MBJ6726560.1 DUF342 domain-containing protein [Geomesophilobacter sediminis]
METVGMEDSGIALKVGDDGHTLVATYTPAPGRSLNRGVLVAALKTQGYAEWLLKDEAVEGLLRKGRAAAIGFSMEIGEKVDGTLSVEVSSDRMEAWLTATPSHGGKKFDEAAITSLLMEHGVVFGIDMAQVAQVAQTGQANHVVIARGIAPVPGEDSQFVSLIPEMAEQAPQLKEGDTADYRNLGGIVSVSLGDPLMRRTRPTPGIPGRDVTGRELPTEDGVELPFAEDMPGVACDLHDSDLLIAAISGYPVALPNGATVDPVFRVKRVDLSTGNLHFKGSLEIEGDVCEGMAVTATEAITVGGIVEAARLDAGGDIEVKGGVIGHGKLSLNDAESWKDAAQLKAGGSITVQFAENAVIQAEGDIFIKELAMQSELTSGAAIHVGESGSRKGHLIGGLSRAASLVEAIVLGSLAGVPTVVEVGVDPALNQKIEYVRETLSEKERLMEELEKTLAYVKENPGSMEPGLLRVKEKVHTKYESEITELTAELKRLLKRMEVNAQAKVVVERDAFIGVQVRIGSSRLLVEEDQMRPMFVLGPDGVEVHSRS